MDLLNDPIPELIKRIALPASVGFLFNTLFNVADTWFAGMISTEAQAALAMSFPIYFVLISLGSGISQGGTALAANALGAKDEAKARMTGRQLVSFAMVLSLLVMAAGFASAPGLFRILGADSETLELSLAYMTVILAGTPFLLGMSVLNSSLNCQGDTISHRNVLIAGSLLNLLLDPWFMFGGYGLPAMGIHGIALATVCIHCLGFLYLAWKVRRTAMGSDLEWRHFIPKREYFKDILIHGLPPGLNMMTVALGIFVITWFVGRFSVEGIAAYGIATRVEQIILLPTIGLNIAVLTLSGQNNGAGRLDRVRETLQCALKYGLILMLGGGVALFLSAERLMALFTRDSAVIRIGGDYLVVAALTLGAYVILYQTVFMLQGLKKPMYSIWIGLYRQILAPFAVFYFLGFVMGWKLKGIWWGIFLVTWSAAIFSFFYAKSVLAKLMHPKE